MVSNAPGAGPMNGGRLKGEPNGNNIEIDLIESNSSIGIGGSGGENDSLMMSGGECVHGIPISVVQQLSAYGVGAGGSALMVMAHGNGNGMSLTSPGGSLEDQDCDEEK